MPWFGGMKGEMVFWAIKYSESINHNLARSMSSIAVMLASTISFADETKIKQYFKRRWREANKLLICLIANF